MKNLLKKLLKCPDGQSLIVVWKTKKEVQALGQVISETKVRVGKFQVASWTSIYTPVADWKQN